MGLVARLFGKEPRETTQRSMSRLQVSTREQTRRELVGMALRDTLKKHGLEAGCITAESVPSIVAGRHPGIHIQMVLRDWQPTLLTYLVALETAVKSRLERLDPLSRAWVAGLSWRFEPKDPTLWPELPVLVQPPSRRPPVPRDAVRAAHIAALHRSMQAGSGTNGSRIPARVDFSPTLPAHLAG